MILVMQRLHEDDPSGPFARTRRLARASLRAIASVNELVEIGDRRF